MDIAGFAWTVFTEAPPRYIGCHSNQVQEQVEHDREDDGEEQREE